MRPKDSPVCSSQPLARLQHVEGMVPVLPPSLAGAKHHPEYSGEVKRSGGSISRKKAQQVLSGFKLVGGSV